MFLWLIHAVVAGIWGNQAKRPRSRWLWKPVIIISLLLIFYLELTPGLTFKKREKYRQKPGKCPENKARCEQSEKDECDSDFDCMDSMKCCIYSCGRKCLDLNIDLCNLLPEVGKCENFELRWYYNKKEHACRYFFYSGCNGNVNNFPTKTTCDQSCAGTVKEGYCPSFPFKGIINCLVTCKNDQNCPGTSKCCISTCGLVCTPPWKVRPWNCPPLPESCTMIKKPQCQNDEDCGEDEKCCSNCGLMCLKKQDLTTHPV